MKCKMQVVLPAPIRERRTVGLPIANNKEDQHWPLCRVDAGNGAIANAGRLAEMTFEDLDGSLHASDVDEIVVTT